MKEVSEAVLKLEESLTCSATNQRHLFNQNAASRPNPQAQAITPMEALTRPGRIPDWIFLQSRCCRFCRNYSMFYTTWRSCKCICEQNPHHPERDETHVPSAAATCKTSYSYRCLPASFFLQRRTEFISAKLSEHGHQICTRPFPWDRDFRTSSAADKSTIRQTRLSRKFRDAVHLRFTLLIKAIAQKYGKPRHANALINGTLRERLAPLHARTDLAVNNWSLRKHRVSQILRPCGIRTTESNAHYATEDRTVGRAGR